MTSAGMLGLNIFSIFSLLALPVARRGWFGLPDSSPGAGGRRPESSNAPQDHLGSIRVLTDEDGGVTERTTWGPWGERLEGGELSRVGYTGHQTERESGLRYSVHRYLDPRNGRWTRRDPLGDVDGQNLYRYVASNPIRHRDFTGLKVSWDSNDLPSNVRSLVEQSAIGSRLLSSLDACEDDVSITLSGGININHEIVAYGDAVTRLNNDPLAFGGLVFGTTAPDSSVTLTNGKFTTSYSYAITVYDGSHSLWASRPFDAFTRTIAALQPSLDQSSKVFAIDYFLMNSGRYSTSLAGTIVHELTHVSQDRLGIGNNELLPNLNQLSFYAELGFRR